MKNRRNEPRSGQRALALLAALAALAAVVTAVVVAYGRLRGLWLEQCVVTDVAAQTEIRSGRRIKPDTVREMFGLRDGANLALIDFSAKREEALKAYPVIKSISVSRRLPDGVKIDVIEREPFARIAPRGSKRDSGLVCDDEGVVFSCRRGAEMLPMIREADSPGASPGERIDGRVRAALETLKIAHEAEFSALTILEIDAARADYLLLTLANYTAVKFRWEGMETPSPAGNAELRAQLTRVAQTIATGLQPSTRIWNATQPGIVTADINGKN